MRHLFLFFAAVFTLTTAAAETPAHTFSVSGYGKVFYDADTCDLMFAVVTETPDVLSCKEKHQKTTAAVKDYANSSLPEKALFAEVSTDLEIVDRYRGNEDITVYRFQTLFSLRTKKVAKLSEIQADLVSRGVNRILAVKLFSDRLPKLIDKARKLAIADARAKAELAAAELGWDLVGATDIAFEEDTWHTRRLSSTYGSRADLTDRAGTLADAAEVYVDAAVRIEFQFALK